MPHRRQKSRARNNSLPDSRSHLMGVFSDDFAAVDVREELCYHSRPEKAKFKRCTEERKQNQKRKLCAAAKAAAGPQADQRGRLRAAAPFDLVFRSFFCLLFRGVCLAAAGEARRTRLCQAHAMVPNKFYAHQIVSRIKNVIIFTALYYMRVDRKGL